MAGRGRPRGSKNKKKMMSNEEMMFARQARGAAEDAVYSNAPMASGAIGSMSPTGAITGALSEIVGGDDYSEKEESLRDEPVKRSYDKKKVSTETLDLIRAMARDRDEWFDRQVEFLGQWNEYLMPTRVGPWEGSSNLHLPMTMEHCLTLHAHLLDVFFAVRPWFYMRPREKLDQQTVEMKEKFMHWALTSYVNFNEGIFPVIDKWIWEIVTTGFGVLKLRWECQYRMAEVIKEEVDSLTGLVTKTVMKEKVKVFDGPVIELLRKQDVYMLGDYDCIQKAPAFAHRVWMTEDTLRRRAESGMFNKKAVEAVIDRKAARRDKMSAVDSMSHDYVDEQDMQEGITTRDSEANPELYEVFEVYRTCDIDGDGFAEEVVLWIEASTGEILRDTDLDKMTKTGNRLLFKGDLYRRPHRAYSMGLVELLYPYNKEIDAIHNQKIDFMTITTIPWFLYNPASGLKNEEMRLGPGVGIPVDDVNNSIRFPGFPQGSGAHNREEETIHAMAGGIAGLSGPIAGNAPTPMGVGRTATGMTTLLQRQNVRVDVFVKRLQHIYSRLLQELDAMLQERAPDGLMFRVLGSDGSQMYNDDGTPVMRELRNREELRGMVDYELLANSANANKEVEFQKSILRSQTLINPLDLQLGLQTPRTVYELRKDMLRQQGVVDPDRFIEKPGIAEKPLEAKDEIASIVQGMKPHVVLNDDHQMKVEVLQAFMKTPEYQQGKAIGNINPNADALFLDTIKQHEKMMQSSQAQAATSNVSGLQIAPSLSARVGGQVDQSTQRPVAETGVKQEASQGLGERPDVSEANMQPGALPV